MEPDVYKTIDGTFEGIYKEKGSKFLAFAFDVGSEGHPSDHLLELKKVHFNARHHCYAYRIGYDGADYKMNDDNEPAYTAGKPILGQIDAFGLTNTMVVVARYFGGTLLGKGGLMAAYKNAAYDALSKATILEKTINDYYKVECGYEEVDKVMRLLNEVDGIPNNQEYGESCKIEIGIRMGHSQQFLKKLEPLHKVKCQFIYTQ
jgi:uncharacterized YigZ family protein